MYTKALCLFFALTINSVNAETWLVKAENKKLIEQKKITKCTYTLLNPNLGADIYEAICPSSLPLALAEKSKIWKIFSKIEINDPMINDQWGLEFIHIRSFWQNFSIGDKSIKVAIIDSGINYFHEDLQRNLAINTFEIPTNGIDDDHNGYVDDYYGWNSSDNSNDPMDDFNHGTHIAGIIGASANNDLGITGMNWNVSLIPIRFVDNRAGGRTEAAIRAIDYAVARGAKIINASWGGTTRSPLLEEMIERCRDKGILFIAAAGNESKDNDLNPTYPASYPLDNLISVAAMNVHKELASFSNWGTKSVHIAAPGESILSTISSARYGFNDGTSMAAPHITGAAALVWAQNPLWNYREVKNYILNHCVVQNSNKLPLLCQGYFSF